MPRAKGFTGRRGRTQAQHAVMERTGWRASPDPEALARRNKRFRLRMKRYEPQDDVAALVRKFLSKKGNRIVKLKPGWALGAHRNGIDILVNG